MLTKLELYWNYLKTCLYYTFIFKHVGRRTVVYKPMRVVNANCIKIGKNTVLEKEATLYSINKLGNAFYNGEISIGNNVYINHHFNATSANSITIEDDVLMAYNVSIFDFEHDYSDIYRSVNNSDLIVKGPIIIGEKSWIGMNVAILGTVKIGKHCIIGANSVVTKDIPDYSIAVGNPARVVKQFNHETKKWEKAAEM
ncbi:acyltransferase [Anaeroarcus burkinensis]|uniref:acyltransferase n=1 Tax=Anaeroarcus burkinensis TaxID=82376 RepID=UPI0006846FF0|nr:acyltransferase [Anaeroarcus burkinensis]